jgi:hypothetical protein
MELLLLSKQGSERAFEGIYNSPLFGNIYLFRVAENNVHDFFRKAARDRKLQTKLLAEATDDPTFSSIGRWWMFGLKYHFTKTGGTDR